MVVKGQIEVQEMILASGGFADIRRGLYMGNPVAVRTVRVNVTPRVDIQKMRKVSADASHSECHLNHFAPAILQGGRPLEHPVPSKHRATDRSLRGHEERTICHRVGVDVTRERHGVHQKQPR